MRTWVVLLMLVASSTTGFAARTATSEGVIEIKLELEQVTALVFPEEVSTVTTPIPEARLMITKDNVYVGFVAIDPTITRHRTIVVSVTGRVYLLQIELVPPGKRGDDLVYISHTAPKRAEERTPASVVRLLRDSKGAGPVQPLTIPLPTVADPRVRLVHPTQYSVEPYQALVVTVVNTQETPLRLDDRVGLDSPDLPQVVHLQHWVWPPQRRLIGVALEHEWVPPGGSTILYAIFEGKP